MTAGWKLFIIGMAIIVVMLCISAAVDIEQIADLKRQVTSLEGRCK